MIYELLTGIAIFATFAGVCVVAAFVEHRHEKYWNDDSVSEQKRMAHWHAHR